MTTQTAHQHEPGSELLQDAANALRMLAVDAVQKANSGHPGMPMGMADIATVLWSRHLRFNPKNPHWLNRDRFILSNGHGCMLLYGLLHLTGYDLPMEEIENFRQFHSRTPGHPEYGHTPGVEVTTGPLGQGISNAVGLALAERHVAERFNRPGHDLIDHFTYVFAGDGDLMEGVSHESCSLAGHLGLSRLIVFYDDNHISIDGSTELAYSDDVGKRFEGYGWHVQHVDGHDREQIDGAVRLAQAEMARPSIVMCRTVIGWGSPNKAGDASTHGSPLGADEVAAVRQNLGWQYPPFEIPAPVRNFWQAAGARGAGLEQEWNEKVAAYRLAFPVEGQELQRVIERKPSEQWRKPLRDLEAEWARNPPADDATRKHSGAVLDVVMRHHPDLVGGSADLTPSNNTRPKFVEDFATGHFGGKYVRYGVREHGMGAIMTGMSRHGGVVPYAGTFLTFSDYMRPCLRLASMQQVQAIYVYTHDSIGLGEDGPTHQPVEHYAALRAIPGLYVLRPADAREVAEAWEIALERTDGPSALLLTRQKVPNLAGSGGGMVRKGAYVLADKPADLDLDVLLLATGSEVHLAMAARERLSERGVGARVVSMPSWELFEQQPEDYRNHVLPPNVTARVGVEAGVKLGWDRWLGDGGRMVHMSSFGQSAPYKQVYEDFGITTEHVLAEVDAVLGRG